MEYFEWCGKKSSDFGIIINSGVTETIGSRDVEYVKVPGVDGEVSVSDGTLQNGSRSFPISLTQDDTNIAEQVVAINNWLLGQSGWHELKTSESPNFVQLAELSDEYDIETTLKDFGKSVIKFKIKPYKLSSDGRTEQPLPATIVNPSVRPGRYKLTVEGEGNITIKINDSVITLTGVDKGFVIDVFNNVAMNLDGSSGWDKVSSTSYPFPTLQPGNNTIATTGKITKATLIPNWEVL